MPDPTRVLVWHDNPDPYIEAVAAAAAQEMQEVEKTEAPTAAVTTGMPLPTAYMVTPPPYAQPPPPPVPAEPELVMGIPKDLLLPASIGALAAVILGVFTISRLTR